MVRSIVKIAIGTALGILFAGAIAAFVVVAVVGTEGSSGDSQQSSERAARIAQDDDLDGDGRPDSTDPDPYSANSASYKAPPKRAEKKPKVARRARAEFVACDPNISVRAATTTCPFAQNVFYGYWTAGGEDFKAYSPASRQSYAMSCSSRDTIVCKAGDGAEVRFSAAAVALYDQDQADAYAASHDLGPDADFDTTYDDEYADESYDDDYAGADYDESYDDYEDPGYNDGDDLTEPGENIPYYDEGDGYRVQCEDGTYSHSGGIQGACSHHGGVR